MFKRNLILREEQRTLSQVFWSQLSYQLYFIHPFAQKSCLYRFAEVCTFVDINHHWVSILWRVYHYRLLKWLQTNYNLWGTVIEVQQVEFFAILRGNLVTGDKFCPWLKTNHTLKNNLRHKKWLHILPKFLIFFWGIQNSNLPIVQLCKIIEIFGKYLLWWLSFQSNFWQLAPACFQLCKSAKIYWILIMYFPYLSRRFPDFR